MQCIKIIQQVFVCIVSSKIWSKILIDAKFDEIQIATFFKYNVKENDFLKEA